MDDHLKEAQLDNSGLSLGDIKLIKESFIKTLKGRFHVRVQYPENDALLVQPTDSVESVPPPNLPALMADRNSLPANVSVREDRKEVVNETTNA